MDVSNGRNCRTCSKSSVCKYQASVVEKVEKMIGEIQDECESLPISVNINCTEWNSNIQTKRNPF